MNPDQFQWLISQLGPHATPPPPAPPSSSHPPPDDARLAEAAVQLGWITPEQLHDALQEHRALRQQGQVLPLGQVLLRRRLLHSDQLAKLLALLHEAPPAEPLLPFPSRLGRYDILGELGRGGMGRVYRAFDPSLKRPVALKLLDGTSDEPRFQREAQAAARLNHPNIVTLYDSATERGQPYLAMELVEGEPLERAWKDWSWRRRVQALELVARAMGYAHRQGVVHRDLKPGNVMVTPRGEVKVMDLGLARVEGESKLTMTGTVMGTPAYMAPEQVRGERVESRADVWALGVMLYEALTEALPFVGSQAHEVYQKILTEEPARPKRLDPRLPLELEWICLKAMEKEAGRRYPTADELADDLRRWMEGEPIRARPASWTTKVRKRVRRNPWAWGLGTTVAIVTAVAGAGALVAMTILRAEREETLRQMRDVTEARLDAALVMRRAGRLVDMKDQLPKVREACERAAHRAPGLAEPHYRLGRMYRALMLWDDALREQDLAIEREPTHAAARYERALLRLRAYGRGMEEATQRWWARLGENLQVSSGGRILPGDRTEDPTQEDLEREEPWLAALREGAEVDLECARGTSASEALLEWLEGNRAKARAHFQRVQASRPELEEPYEYLALLSATLEEAELWYEAGIRRDSGYLPFWWGRAVARRAEAHRRLRGKIRGDPGPIYEQTIADYSRAIELDPLRWESYLGRGRVRFMLGKWAEARGSDPTELYRLAMEDYERTLQQDAGQVEAWTQLGVARFYLGVYQASHGIDPSDAYRSALSAYDEALGLSASSDAAWRGRAGVHTNWAVYRKDHGEDPTGLLRQAVEDCEKALGCNPARPETCRSVAEAKLVWASWEDSRGLDPTSYYREAIVALNEALARDPFWDIHWIRRGEAQAERALWLEEHGQDPLRFYARAMKDFDRAVALNPSRDLAWSRRAGTRFRRETWRASRGGDPRKAFQEAILEYGEALRRDPEEGDTWLGRAEVFSAWGQHEGTQGRDPTACFRAALQDCEEALRRNPNRAVTWWRRADLRVNWALFARSSGEDPRRLLAPAYEDYTRAIELDSNSDIPWMGRAYSRVNLMADMDPSDESSMDYLAGAISDFDEALRRNPNRAKAWMGRALARMNRGIRELRQSRDPTSFCEDAVRDFSEALRINPQNAEAWSGRGLARAILGCWKKTQGDRSPPVLQGALQDAVRAVELAPADAEALWRRGYCRYLLEDWTGALSDFEAALRIRPGVEPQIRAWASECRRWLEGTQPQERSDHDF